ncbi:exodeoxyribonuclease VII large subunit [Mitsuokella sp.]|uniref:exodeoxyribonuclease VII large subunit n=1 Tax=Mitsuokella sp. TaxID=2049034 RepID=UPI003D7D6D4B
MEIHSVSDVTRYIKTMFQRETVLSHLQVRGELSNFKCYASGHCYFTLKDANSCIKCVMFRSRAQYLRFRPENGMQVVVSGGISVYERDGVYQLYADRMTPEGAGDLALAFEQLKVKLAAEGLFDAAHKKPLPKFPKRIGIVTSISGAVLRDIYHVSKRRWPAIQLVLKPVLVQGEEAAEQIADAIRFFNEKYPVDVLIVGRGGGSMEDLWAFNEEPVVRAIYDSRIPVISAVGHETDFTLADFASDQRAATPSQAAELAVPDREDYLRYLESLRTQLGQQLKRALTEKRLRLDACCRSTALKNPHLLLASRLQRLDQARNKLDSLTKAQAQAKRHALEIVLQKLDLLNPMHILRQGYGIIEKESEGGAVSSIKDVKKGDELTVTLKDGRFSAEVRQVKPPRA